MKIGSHLHRFMHVLRVILRHVVVYGLSRALRRWPHLARRLCGAPLSGPERFKCVIEEMGGTLIKFGQMLALQSDLLPLEYCRILFTLFDSLAPFPFEQVERIFREDLGRSPADLFDTFDRQSIAAGSIGQVHVATLAGRKVAVKVQRPSIVDDFAVDIASMKLLVRAVRLLRIRALIWIIAPTEEFVSWTQDELDFRREAHYMDELGRNAQGNPTEKVPAVFWSHTTARILTAEFLEGLTISAYLRNAEHNSARIPQDFDPDRLAANLVDNFLGDAFRHGMFHADLHPGNLMIMSGNVVGYLDFGISGVLSRYSRRHLIAMTLAYARGDLEGMCEAFFRITTRDGKADMTVFRQRLRQVSSAWYGEHSTDNRLRKSITSIMLDLLVLSRESGIWPQRDVIKYIRSAIALDGLIKTFSPHADIGRHLERACQRHLRWESVRNFTSRDTIAAWMGSYASLARDGGFRAFSLLRRIGREQSQPASWNASSWDSETAPLARRRRRIFRSLELLWLAAGAYLLLRPASTAHPHSVSLLALFLVAALAWLFWKTSAVVPVD